MDLGTIVERRVQSYRVERTGCACYSFTIAKATEHTDAAPPVRVALRPLTSRGGVKLETKSGHRRVTEPNQVREARP